MILIYSTFPSLNSAKSISELLLEKKLIFCANFWEHNSLYLGKTSDTLDYNEKILKNMDDGNSQIITSYEVGVVYKTSSKNWNELCNLFSEIHPYSTPILLKINVEELNSEFKEHLSNYGFK
ncbi:divalent cation tolerance protein CutA [Methanococcus voltae]|uniref:CutA1 divalent ion tolerance protein n=1 Tax=Methanococcus voltae (strain ATCC BAA-1334 / A3) TaxID=456320 RepID=D7DTI1_METV3|nr:divalent cation tolerance protein CutA [Methanococcus voltae]MCS3901293.1 periplasmic divalent cation tolerance protein [Methanococcus voltae]